MAAVEVNIPSTDIRAVGISIRPVVPKSEAFKAVVAQHRRSGIKDRYNRFLKLLLDFVRGMLSQTIPLQGYLSVVTGWSS